MKIRPEVEWFAQEMEKKLVKNEHRPGWGDANHITLLGCLKRHVEKLERSIAGKDAERLIPDAADIANFAMMIADNERFSQKISLNGHPEPDKNQIQFNATGAAGCYVDDAYLDNMEINP